MAIASIQDWLRLKGPMSMGVELLKLHGKPTAADLFLFDQPESSFSRGRLERALRDLNDQAIHTIAAAPAPATPGPAEPLEHELAALKHSLRQEPPRDIPEEALPLELQPLRRQLKYMHQEMLMLRGMMVKVPDGSELRDIADKVVALHDEIRSGWRRIEYYRATGKLLADSPPATNTVELMRELRAISVWLSQRKSGARKSTTEQIEAKQARKRVVEQLLKDAVPA
jgi:hypothetical protein